MPLDFLGDVVCGGWLPIARDMCQKVIVVASNDLQSLYVANNVCSAVDYFRKMGGNVGVAGMVVNRTTARARRTRSRAVGIPVLAAIPADDDIRRKSASYEISAGRAVAGRSLFEQLAQQVADAPPVARAADPRRCWGCSRATLSAATSCSIRLRWKTCAGDGPDQPSLEVVYEGA